MCHAPHRAVSLLSRCEFQKYHLPSAHVQSAPASDSLASSQACRARLTEPCGQPSWPPSTPPCPVSSCRLLQFAQLTCTTFCPAILFVPLAANQCTRTPAPQRLPTQPQPPHAGGSNSSLDAVANAPGGFRVATTSLIPGDSQHAARVQLARRLLDSHTPLGPKPLGPSTPAACWVFLVQANVLTGQQQTALYGTHLLLTSAAALNGTHARATAMAFPSDA